VPGKSRCLGRAGAWEGQVPGRSRCLEPAGALQAPLRATAQEQELELHMPESFTLPEGVGHQKALGGKIPPPQDIPSASQSLGVQERTPVVFSGLTWNVGASGTGGLEEVSPD
jgi:hypothetical protein